MASWAKTCSVRIIERERDEWFWSVNFNTSVALHRNSEVRVLIWNTQCNRMQQYNTITITWCIYFATVNTEWMVDTVLKFYSYIDNWRIILHGGIIKTELAVALNCSHCDVTGETGLKKIFFKFTTECCGGQDCTVEHNASNVMCNPVLIKQYQTTDCKTCHTQNAETLLNLLSLSLYPPSQEHPYCLYSYA
jgi:hypothetical protein